MAIDNGTIMSRSDNNCVMFIVQFPGEYRVVYNTDDEWHIDAPSSSLCDVRTKAKRCMEALYIDSGCAEEAIRVYEVSVSGHLGEAMLNGLHDGDPAWQRYMDTAVIKLNSRQNVSMASFVSDGSEANQQSAYEAFLLVVSSNLQTGLHYFETVPLLDETGDNNVGVLHKISHGKPCLYIEQPHNNNIVYPQSADIDDALSVAV